MQTILNAALVVLHAAYERIYYSRPFENVPETIYLTEKNVPLEDLVITAEIFSREQKLEAFRLAFLGDDWYGKRCSIYNEDDIKIQYDSEQLILLASSDK